MCIVIMFDVFLVFGDFVVGVMMMEFVLMFVEGMVWDMVVIGVIIVFGKGVVVGIVDSGVDVGYFDFVDWIDLFLLVGCGVNGVFDMCLEVWCLGVGLGGVYGIYVVGSVVGVVNGSGICGVVFEVCVVVIKVDN